MIQSERIRRALTVVRFAHRRSARLRSLHQRSELLPGASEQEPPRPPQHIEVSSGSFGRVLAPKLLASPVCPVAVAPRQSRKGPLADDDSELVDDVARESDETDAKHETHGQPEPR